MADTRSFMSVERSEQIQNTQEVEFQLLDIERIGRAGEVKSNMTFRFCVWVTGWMAAPQLKQQSRVGWGHGRQG